MAILSVLNPAHDNNCRFLYANFHGDSGAAIETELSDRPLSFGNLSGN
jgi:hypothetical protein